MENHKEIIEEMLNEIEEGGVKLLTDDKKRKLMIESIRKYNQALEEKIKFLEGEQEKEPEEEPKEEKKVKDYRELAKEKSIRR